MKSILKSIFKNDFDFAITLLGSLALAAMGGIVQWLASLLGIQVFPNIQGFLSFIISLFIACLIMPLAFMIMLTPFWVMIRLWDLITRFVKNG